MVISPPIVRLLLPRTGSVGSGKEGAARQRLTSRSQLQSNRKTRLAGVYFKFEIGVVWPAGDHLSLQQMRRVMDHLSPFFSMGWSTGEALPYHCSQKRSSSFPQVSTTWDLSEAHPERFI